ncbi:MAG: hypothetical protein HY517_04645 [Candidatus Aenigmarchaeota archaeon]|nr:hypothetical protein [Candidatus Aenigmarchaeota archaeon]
MSAAKDASSTNEVHFKDDPRGNRRYYIYRNPPKLPIAQFRTNSRDEIRFEDDPNGNRRYFIPDNTDPAWAEEVRRNHAEGKVLIGDKWVKPIPANAVPKPKPVRPPGSQPAPFIPEHSRVPGVDYRSPWASAGSNNIRTETDSSSKPAAPNCNPDTSPRQNPAPNLRSQRKRYYSVSTEVSHRFGDRFISNRIPGSAIFEDLMQFLESERIGTIEDFSDGENLSIAFTPKAEFGRTPEEFYRSFESRLGSLSEYWEPFDDLTSLKKCEAQGRASQESWNNLTRESKRERAEREEERRREREKQESGRKYRPKETPKPIEEPKKKEPILVSRRGTVIDASTGNVYTLDGKLGYFPGSKSYDEGIYETDTEYLIKISTGSNYGHKTVRIQKTLATVEFF